MAGAEHAELHVSAFVQALQLVRRGLPGRDHDRRLLAVNGRVSQFVADWQAEITLRFSQDARGSRDAGDDHFAPRTSPRGDLLSFCICRRSNAARRQSPSVTW